MVERILSQQNGTKPIEDDGLHQNELPTPEEEITIGNTRFEIFKVKSSDQSLEELEANSPLLFDLLVKARGTYSLYGETIPPIDEYDNKSSIYLTRAVYPREVKNGSVHTIKVEEWASLRFIPLMGEPYLNEDFDFYVYEDEKGQTHDILDAVLATEDLARLDKDQALSKIWTQSRFCAIRPTATDINDTHVLEESRINGHPIRNNFSSISFALMNKQFLVDQAQTPPAFITGQLHLELSDKILEFPSRSGSDIRMPFTPAHVTLFGSEQNKHNIRVNREDNWEYVYSYPGYFLDNKLFAEQVQWLIEHEQLDKKLIADYLPEDLDVDDFLAKPKMTHFRELGKLLTQEGPLEFRSGEISEKSMTGEELRDHLNRFVQDGAVWRLMPREEWEEGVEKMINSAKYYQIFQERQGKVPSLPSLRYQEYLEEKVTQKERTLIADDFIEMLQPSNEGVSDVAVRQLFDHINDLDEKEFVFQKITKQYLLQLEEYFNEFGGQDGETKQAFIERFTQHNNGTWVRNKIDGTVLRVVPQEMLIKLLQRRANLAGMDHEQLEKIADSSVAFFGTSTGSHPFMQLVRMGIKQAHVTDVKEWKTSNLNRTAQGTLADLGVHKPVNLVSDALMINPYLNITVHPNVVKDGEVDIPTAEAIIRDSNLVIEMTDNFKIKSKIPTLAVKNGVPALCPDNVGIEPSVRVYIDESDLPDFPEVLNMEGFINIIGKDYISLQMMINTILTSERKMGFIAQQGPTAALTGAMTSINASRLLAGEEISRHIHVNYTNEMLSPEVQLEEYEQLEQHMRHQYPDIFALEDEQGYLSPLAKLVDDYVYKATGIETNYYSQIEQLRQTSL